MSSLKNNQTKCLILISSKNPKKGFGDIYTAQELGLALKNKGWLVSYVSIDDNYVNCKGIDVFINLLHRFNLKKIRNEDKKLKKVAWIRNNLDNWINHSNLKDYDIILCSSKTGCKYLKSKTSKESIYFPISTNPKRFNGMKQISQKYNSDIVFTGSYWSHYREIIEFIESYNLPYSFKVYGKNWEKIRKNKKNLHGFIEYKELPEVYSSTKIVIDDANHVTKDHGLVNSRVYDALASNCLVLTNNLIGSRDQFKSVLPTYGSVDELKKLIKYYMENDKERRLKIKELKNIVLSRFTYDKRATQLENIIKKDSESN